MSDRLFGLDEVPEVPLFREPRRSRGAPIMDERLDHDYPPDWDRCAACDGYGSEGTCAPGESLLDLRRRSPCPRCLGMGSLRARVRLEAGHRCVRCGHPYMPKGDAAMLGVKASGLHPCDRCGGSGRDPEVEQVEGGTKYNCLDCKGTGEAWTPWSACDERCTHGGPLRVVFESGETSVLSGAAGPPILYAEPSNVVAVEAEWRILTVHHLDGDKANLRWWNLAALCQRCHLEIQGRVVMERVYPHEHSEWFKPYVAGYYAFVYLCKVCGLGHGASEANHRGRVGSPMPLSIGPINENGYYPHPFEPGLELSREQALARMDELLALELDPSYRA